MLLDFTELFYEARSFNQDINSWNVSKVTDFTNCLDLHAVLEF